MMSALPVSMDQVQRRVQHEIVKGRPLDDIPESTVEDQEEPLYMRLLLRISESVAMGSFRALQVGGILPWSRSRYWPSLLFQVAVFLLHIGIFAYEVAQVVAADQTAGVLPYTDLIVSLGVVLGLASVLGFQAGGQLADCVKDLEEMAANNTFEPLVAVSCTTDALLLSLGWIAFLATRFSLLLALPPQAQAPQRGEALVNAICSIVSSLELLLVAAAVLRVTRYLTSMVDSFCIRFWADMHYSNAVEEWNVLQATVRMACGSVEHCFVVLQCTVVLGSIAVVWDLVSARDRNWATLSFVLLFAAVSQAFYRAATVTEACTRVPQLVNSTSWNNVVLDPDRKYLVDYIAASKAGFYTFNVRLSMSVVIRLLHYTCLIAATIARLEIGA